LEELPPQHVFPSAALVEALQSWADDNDACAGGRDLDPEFVANEPGDWAFHCHRSHHTMNAMGHTVPNMIGVNMSGLDKKINALLPEYMGMGSGGMADMSTMQMPLPENTVAMQTGQGPFGPVEMGGMFTILKVRADLAANDYRDPGWYTHPKGTVAYLLGT